MDVTRVVPKAGFVVAAWMVVALVAAAAASAQSVVSHDNDTRTIRYVDADPADEDLVTVEATQDGSDNYYAIGSTGDPVVAGTNCQDDGPVVLCPRGPETETLTAVLGGDDDRLDLSGLAAGVALPSNVQGGPGDDRLIGGVLGDAFSGGDGEDVMVGLSDGDAFSGGADGDVLDLSGSGSSTVTLDGSANDGAGADGGNANVQADVEEILGGPGDDEFTGTVGSQALWGGGGSDILTGGGGADILSGDAGGDFIFARDGAVDDIHCGGGTDAVQADWNDTVDADCENVERSLRDDDGDGSPNGVDCNDADPNVKPGGGDVPGNGIDEDCAGGDAAVDADGDGAAAAADCDDADPARFPGAPEVPANGVDENCDGVDGSFPTVAATISSGWKVFARYTKLTSLKINGAPPGAKVRVTCKGKGKGCPFKRKTTRANAQGSVALTKRFKGARLKPGAVIEVRVSADDAIAKVLRITIRKRKAPKRATLCLPPGASKPAACG
jgi:hypothetical protein